METVATQMLYDDNVKLKLLMEKLLSPNIFNGENCVQVFSTSSKADRGLQNPVIASYWLSRENGLAFFKANGNECEEKR